MAQTKEAILAYRKKYREKYPYKLHWDLARKRCNNPKERNYKWYGAKGIKFSLSVEDVKFLWERDKGWLLKKSSLDRINPKKNYVLSNCRFIELSENLSRAARGTRRKSHCRSGHEYTAETLFITTKGETNCRFCMRGWNRESRKRMKAEHRCMGCGKQLEENYKFVSCSECLKKARGKSKKYNRMKSFKRTLAAKAIALSKDVLTFNNK